MIPHSWRWLSESEVFQCEAKATTQHPPRQCLHGASGVLSWRDDDVALCGLHRLMLERRVAQLREPVA